MNETIEKGEMCHKKDIMKISWSDDLMMKLNKNPIIVECRKII